jgi:hypothetical protein
MKNNVAQLSKLLDIIITNECLEKATIITDPLPRVIHEGQEPQLERMGLFFLEAESLNNRKSLRLLAPLLTRMQ